MSLCLRTGEWSQTTLLGLLGRIEVSRGTDDTGVNVDEIPNRGVGRKDRGLNDVYLEGVRL